MLSLRLLVLFLILPSVAANLLINEVMYAPSDGNEWVEIYNPTSQAVNLSGWSLIDNKNTDTIRCCLFNQTCSLLIPALSYAIITDQDTTLYHSLQTDALKICVDDNSLGNGLSNSGDSLKIFNGTYEDYMDYNSSHANQNGMTLELDHGFWRESYVLGGTPGKGNSQAQQISLNIPNSTVESDFQQQQQEQIDSVQERTTPKFKIKKLVKKVTPGENVQLDVALNNGDSNHKFTVWSYIYSGSKCISCGSGTREANQQTTSLAANEEKLLSFNLDVPENVKGGEYKLKVKILKDEQTTPYELKEVILIMNKTLPPSNSTQVLKTFLLEKNFTENNNAVNYTVTESTSLAAEILPQEKQTESAEVIGSIVYQSEERKLKKLIPYFVIVTIVLLASIYIFKQ